jgi:hypothetical protein
MPNWTGFFCLTGISCEGARKMEWLSSVVKILAEKSLHKVLALGFLSLALLVVFVIGKERERSANMSDETVRHCAEVMALSHYYSTYSQILDKGLGDLGQMRAQADLLGSQTADASAKTRIDGVVKSIDEQISEMEAIRKENMIQLSELGPQVGQAMGELTAATAHATNP